MVVKKKLIQSFVLMVASVQLVACGNITTNSKSSTLSKNQLSASSSYDDSEVDPISTAYKCPENPNINPKWDDPLVDEGRYKACRNRDGSYEYLFMSDAAMPINLCVIPYAVMNGVQKVYKSANGVTYALCERVYDNQIKVKLDNLAIPATGAMVVDQNDLEKLRACIANTSLVCPDFSKGNL